MESKSYLKKNSLLLWQYSYCWIVSQVQDKAGDCCNSTVEDFDFVVDNFGRFDVDLNLAGYFGGKNDGVDDQVALYVHNDFGHENHLENLDNYLDLGCSYCFGTYYDDDYYFGCDFHRLLFEEGIVRRFDYCHRTCAIQTLLELGFHVHPNTEDQNMILVYRYKSVLIQKF